MIDRNAVKVGIASFLMLVVLSSLLIWKSGIFYRLDGYEVVGEFASVNGLVNGADVRYRGSKVGKVFSIDPTPQAVLVRFRVESHIQIPKNSIVKIYFDGLIGEKFLNIIPNPEETEMLANGDHMKGTASAGLAEFVEVGAQNLEATKAVLQVYQKMLTDSDMVNSFANTIKSVEKISADLAILTTALAGEGQNGGSLKKMMSDMSDTTGLVKKNTEILLQDGQIAGGSKQAILNLVAMTDQLKSVVAALSGQVVTSANLDKVNQTLDNVHNITLGVRNLAGTDVKYGPVGALQAFSKVKISATGEVVPITSIADQSSYEGYVDTEWDTAFVRAGVSGVKSSNHPGVNLQYGKRVGDAAAARAGYFGSHVGAGVDFFPTNRTKVSVEVYNIDSPKVGVRGKYALTKDMGVVMNWKSKAATSDEPVFGLGVSFGSIGATE